MNVRGDRVTAGELGTQRSTCAPTQKKCGACGELFACGAPGPDCWCEVVKLSPAALAQLRARYADCLCPRCLAAVEPGAPQDSA
jgi:Cysteine-rich CWC